MKTQLKTTNHYPRLLTPGEIDSLLKEAKESSTWMRKELKRRRAENSDDLTGEVNR